ncbi:MAG TPA: Flp pilus assembly protein CpaB [Gaiellaceae bacterium]|nr:Flp pilus assembly protein CpaB [Gaiellaceae bacterium]
MNDFKSLSYRTRNVLVAAALAILAVALTLIYTAHAKKNAQSSSAGPVPVLVATRDIPIGTAGSTLASRGWVVTKSYERSDVPEGAITNMNQVATLVAIQPTYKDELLVAARFGSTQQEGVLATLKGAYRIVQLPGDANQLLAGTLKQGNRVDVVGSWKVPETAENHDSAVLLRNLLVVTTPSKPSTGDNGATSVELRVTGAQAQRLFWLEKNADWSLLLRPSTDATDQHPTPTTAVALLQDANGH